VRDGLEMIPTTGSDGKNLHRWYYLHWYLFSVPLPILTRKQERKFKKKMYYYINYNIIAVNFSMLTKGFNCS